ncbi:MAG: hypothetical protein AAF713_08435 [Pseudomonadota bacterium]
MRIAIPILLLAALLAFAYSLVDASNLAQWAAEWQRSFQNQIATAIQGLRSGAPGAMAALLAAAGAYGFVHAIGPGHGKYLIGGVGLGSSVARARLVGIAVASSLMQALWAICIVYGGFLLLELSAPNMTILAERYLAPASYIAIAAIGAVLVWRGAWALAKQLGARDDPHGKDRQNACGCHGHGPSPDELAALRSSRDVVAMIASIAVRPCTGAIFLLVIAWQLDIRAAGALAVVVMGLGTAALTSLVAVSSIAAREMTFASAGRVGAVSNALPTLQVVAGVLIFWISLALHDVAA